MTFDNSRFTFDPWNDYSGVVMEQGRVQSDADWNEWLAELSRRIRAGTLDTLGRAVYPATTPYAFQITASTAGGSNSISIGAGRMYVDGLLAENHGLSANAQWDPALAELSGSPQPPLSTNSNTIDYTKQPYYPNPDTSLLSGSGSLLAYLDVWTRSVSYLQDPNLVDPAIAVDTTGRLQTVWQVKLMAVPTATPWSCATPDFEIPYPAPSAARLTTGTVTNPSAGPCCLTTGSGYSGIENQFYRVEIHNGGANSDTPSLSGATFKWSRDNASVETGVTAIASGSNSLGQPASVLTVLSLGRDQVLGFLPGNWIEILDEAHQLNGLPGELHLIDTIDAASRSITLATTTSAAFPVGTPEPGSHTRIRRWDQSGKVYEEDLTTVWWDLAAAGSNGAIPVPLSDKTLVLENGITITFSLSSPTGSFGVGDFWTFAARTADGSVGPLADAPPRGPHHHYTKLSIVSFSPLSNTNCRNEWPPGGGQGSCGCCTCTVGDGIESVGQFTSIQQAINSLPVTGGAICVQPGRYFEHVVIENLSDVVIYGCGCQTRLASPSLHAGSAGSASLAPAGSTAASGLAAVITITGSQHIELRSFCVEAADQEVGILLDRVSTQAASQGGGGAGQKPASVDARLAVGDTDITIKDLVITASTLPAIAALTVELLEINDNRIAMADVPSLWPAVYASGREIRIEHNWIGLQDASNAPDWVPASVAADLAADAAAAGAASTQTAETLAKRISAPGGVQIGGPSKDVHVVDNEIDGGSHNGITLGSIAILDQSGIDTGATIGVFVSQPDECSTTSTLQIPGSSGSGSNMRRFGAGGVLADIQISRNRIRNSGLCGIGPVGFFDLETTTEVISIHNLSITANDIWRSVLGSLEPFDAKNSAFGYGAICVPDVENLIINDNVITDFGEKPGIAQACGIFVLNAEMAEISRNQIRETRDWSLAFSDADGNASSVRGGIVVLLVAPPTFLASAANAAWSAPGSAAQGVAGSAQYSNLATPTYEPGLPALRVEHNRVRVALGQALEVFGFGPFSIVNNHFATGGSVAVRGTPPALSVLILNLGLSIELANLINGFGDLYNQTLAAAPDRADSGLAASANGTVLFTNNVCQVEARANRQRGLTSVMIASLDHILFANNHCWVDGAGLCAALDALLLAVSVQVNSNRFQEALGSVLASGLTCGLINITSQNLSTYCLFAKGIPSMLVNSSNITWVPNSLCAEIGRSLLASSGG